MKVGDTVYAMNVQTIDSTIWHCVTPRKIVGETLDSWLVGTSKRRYNKKTRDGLYTIEQVQQMASVAIDELLGYK